MPTHRFHKLNQTCVSLLFALPLPCLVPAVQAQHTTSRLFQGTSYNIGLESSISHHQTPFWMVSNRYGLSSVDRSNGLMTLGLRKDSRQDSLHHWRLGYVAEVAVGYNQTSIPIIQQMAVNVDYKRATLSIGAVEEPMSLKNQELSSGGQTFGINSRPIPQIKLGLPEYWCFTGKKHPWGALRGFISYGMLTDGKFQRDYVLPDQRYSRKVLYHAKAGYLRLGNPAKFPLTFEAGLEMASQYGGTIYNYQLDDGTLSEPIHMSHKFQDVIDATFGVGNDPTDGVYANAAGNTVGSWLFRLNYEHKDWTASVYYDHYFEDHSQMFLEYGWLDGLVGVELKLKKTPYLSNIVYEFVKTTYQSGPLYHDHTEAIPDQISGNDKYYNHGLYMGWQHWGQAIGNPLFISPLYNNDGNLEFRYNRFKAHHVGIAGNILPDLHYRARYTFQRNWGTYDDPTDYSKVNHSVMLEATYSPAKIGKFNTKGWAVGVGFGLDHGTLLGNNTGFQFHISKTGILIP